MTHLSLVLIIIIIFSLYACYIIFKLALIAHRQKIVAGREAIIGVEGIVVSLSHHRINVLVLGELWDAESYLGKPLHLRQNIKVVSIKGLKLTVVANDNQ